MVKEQSKYMKYYNQAVDYSRIHKEAKKLNKKKYLVKAFAVILERKAKIYNQTHEEKIKLKRKTTSVGDLAFCDILDIYPRFKYLGFDSKVCKSDILL